MIYRTYKHKNGYSAVLYGKSSMSVYRREKEVFHTGSRNINTEDKAQPAATIKLL